MSIERVFLCTSRAHVPELSVGASEMSLENTMVSFWLSRLLLINPHEAKKVIVRAQRLVLVLGNQ